MFKVLGNVQSSLGNVQSSFGNVEPAVIVLRPSDRLDGLGDHPVRGGDPVPVVSRQMPRKTNAW